MVAVQEGVGTSGLTVESQPGMDAHLVARDMVRWALAVAGAKQAERVVRLDIRVGPDPRLKPEDLEFAISLLTRTTIAEGARITVRPVDNPGIAVEQVVVR